MTSPAKVIVIGIDSVDRNLLLKWSDSGDLLVMQSLREKGVCGLLTSPPAMGDDATWVSFYTAVSPARHGRYFWTQIQPGSYTMLQFRDAYLKCEPFWNTLSRAGCRVAIIDVPKSPLSTNLNGFQLADWLVHGRDHDTCSWPSDIALDVLARFGDDRTDRWGTDEYLCRVDSLSEGEYEIFLKRLLDNVDKKVTVASEFLAREDWDLFLVVFKESHCVGHQCWHLLDEMHPRTMQRLRTVSLTRSREFIRPLILRSGTCWRMLVRKLVRLSSLYCGEHRDCLPDLFVVWIRDNPITAVVSTKIGELRVGSTEYRTGNHVANGIYIGQGPAVSRGEEVGYASIMDIAPTIGVLLDTPMPDTDGKPISALGLGSDFPE